MFNLVPSVNSSSITIEPSQSNQYDQMNTFTKQPSCIVIGCKNGEGKTNSNIKYYQVPSIHQNARQWYINTLREDLYESLQNSASINQPSHFVCIEHFDEESFVNGQMLNEFGNYEQMMHMKLKEDAVPSLFEIEVFQKMISHTEQLNQQQQSIMVLQQQTQNDDSNISNKNIESTSTSVDFQNESEQSKQPAAISNASSKRSRMDPDLRASLMQRVPKALKRTTVQASQIEPLRSAANSVLSKPLPKAVKHTMPRSVLQPTTNSQMTPSMGSSILNEIMKMPLDDQTKTSGTSTKAHKAVKHTSNLSINSNTAYLKELLPPPIMQSTKRVPMNSVPNKAVKRTSGSGYIQHSANSGSNNNQLTQLSLNNLNNLESFSNSNKSGSTIVPTPVVGTHPANGVVNTNGNRVTITTTYVYKRVSQQPEIDLELECEDEEIIEVIVPAPADSNDENEKEKRVKPSEDKSIQVDLDPQEETTISEDKTKELSTTAGKLDLKLKSEQPGKLPVEEKKQLVDSVKNSKTPNRSNSKLNKSAIISRTNETSNSNNWSAILGKYYGRKLSTVLYVGGVKRHWKTIPADLRRGNFPAKVNLFKFE
jgi:hypothetical protein